MQQSLETFYPSLAVWALTLSFQALSAIFFYQADV